MLDQLVERELVSRREDARDRRAKRVDVTEKGRMLITALEQQRVDAQLVVMQYLSASDQADVLRAMALLAEAGERRRHNEHPKPSATG
jgi:DNA-binding MarR family transcriptional regulator